MKQDLLRDIKSKKKGSWVIENKMYILYQVKYRNRFLFLKIDYRYRFRAKLFNVTSALPNVTDCYRMLPLQALQALSIVIEGVFNIYLKFY